MQSMQVSYGLATSTEVAYFTYIYASVSGDMNGKRKQIKLTFTTSGQHYQQGDKLHLGRLAARQIPVWSAVSGPAE